MSSLPDVAPTPEPKPQAQTPQDEIEAIMDKAIRAGATIEDLEALLEERGLVVHIEAGEAELLETVPAAESDTAPAEGAETPAPVSRGRLTSIMERAKGNALKAKGIANWILGKRAKVLADYADAEALANENKAQIDTWLKRQSARRDRALNWQEWLLRGASLDLQEKKLDLPAGTVAWQKKQVESKWDEAEGVRFVIRQAFARMKEVFAETSDRTKAEVAAYEMMAELLTIKRDPVKKLLDRRDDGSHGYVNEDNQPVTVISVREVGEVPLVPTKPGADPEKVERVAQPWVKPNESYRFVIK